MYFHEFFLSFEKGANGVELEDDMDEELEDDAGSNSEAEKMMSSSPSMASTGLSVVRPEVLFGQAGGMGMPDFGKMMMGIGGQQVRYVHKCLKKVGTVL